MEEVSVLLPVAVAGTLVIVEPLLSVATAAVPVDMAVVVPKVMVVPSLVEYS